MSTASRWARLHVGGVNEIVYRAVPLTGKIDEKTTFEIELSCCLLPAMKHGFIPRPKLE